MGDETSYHRHEVNPVQLVKRERLSEGLNTKVTTMDDFPNKEVVTTNKELTAIHAKLDEILIALKDFC